MRHTEPRTRIEWLPGSGLLAIAMGVGAVLGYAVAAGRPPVLLSLVVLALMIALSVRGLSRRPGRAYLPFSTRRAAPQDARHPFDLVRDRSTDSQKYVM